MERSDSPAGRSPWVGLLLADLRKWARDPMLGVAAVGPFALAVVLRVSVPVVTSLARPLIDLEPLYPTIAATMTVFAPAIYGFVVGMFVLEDREQGVLTAYRTSPLSDRAYLCYRGATAYVLGFGATLPALAVLGFVTVPPAVLVGTTAVGAFGGPVIALTFGTVAANTIEGLAVSKLINLVVLGPAVAIAVLPVPLQYLAGIVPTYWPLAAAVAGITGDPRWPWFLLGGALTYGLALAWLGRRFARRID